MRSFGTDINYNAVYKRFLLEAGVKYYKLNEEYIYDEDYVYITPNGIDFGIHIFKNEFKYISFEIGGGYFYDFDKFKLSIQLKASMDKLLSTDAVILEPEKRASVIETNKIDFYKDRIFYLAASPKFHYQLVPSIYITAEPVFRSSLGSISNSQYFKMMRNIYDLRVGLTHQF
ncbi:MAG TPA: hypothetical protein VIK89_00275 [Cytophagaceae bacterium]